MKIIDILSPLYASADRLAVDLRSFLFDHTRFFVEVSIHTPKNALPWINLTQIRLKVAKEYCGSHPAACENAFAAPRHRKLRCLEGADWVEFNDTINDWLDCAYASATVFSEPRERSSDRVGPRRLYIRMGNYRRMIYRECTSPRPGQNATWDTQIHSNHFTAEHFGEPASYRPSDFPEGTPGVYSRAHHAVVG